jgi:predicted RNA-binding protein Jag
LREVDDALGKLREDSSLQSVKLKPTNSFYRRVQHQKIVDSGFESSSVGEGADRAVKVTRKG